MMLIIGANGQLGQCFQQAALSRPGIIFLFKSSTELDITRFAAVSKTLHNLAAQYPELWVVNCAAYTAVDKAESEPVQARRVNVQGVRNLARVCAKLGLPLIHFSTDYVYHSKQNTPFVETDSVHPGGVYAKTKLAGERAALQLHPAKTMVIRTSWVYSAFGNNFVKTMLRLGAERPHLRVVWDQIGSPTYAPDLADAVIQIHQQVATGKIAVESIGGIWHYANEGVASWYDLAGAVFEYEQLACTLEPITTQEYPTPARRPPFSVLDKSKIKSAFGLDIPHWRTSLQKCLKALSATSKH